MSATRRQGGHKTVPEQGPHSPAFLHGLRTSHTTLWTPGRAQTSVPMSELHTAQPEALLAEGPTVLASCFVMTINGAMISLAINLGRGRKRNAAQHRSDLDYPRRQPAA